MLSPPTFGLRPVGALEHHREWLRTRPVLLGRRRSRTEELGDSESCGNDAGDHSQIAAASYGNRGS